MHVLPPAQAKAGYVLSFKSKDSPAQHLNVCSKQHVSPFIIKEDPQSECEYSYQGLREGVSKTVFIFKQFEAKYALAIPKNDNPDSKGEWEQEKKVAQLLGTAAVNSSFEPFVNISRPVKIDTEKSELTQLQLPLVMDQEGLLSPFRETNLEDHWTIALKLPLYKKYFLLFKIATSLKFLHDNGVVHRDLQAKNILLSEELGVHIPYLSDFGKSFIKKYDKNNEPLYLPLHLLPPLKDEKDNRKRKKADIFAFGILCFELLTGVAPEDLPFHTTHCAKACPRATLETLTTFIKEKRGDGQPNKYRFWPQSEKLPQEAEEIISRMVEDDPRCKIKEVCKRWEKVAMEAMVEEFFKTFSITAVISYTRSTAVNSTEKPQVVSMINHETGKKRDLKVYPRNTTAAAALAYLQNAYIHQKKKEREEQTTGPCHLAVGEPARLNGQLALIIPSENLTLEKFQNEIIQLPYKEKLRLLSQLTESVRFLHEIKMVHCGIELKNVLCKLEGNKITELLLTTFNGRGVLLIPEFLEIKDFYYKVRTTPFTIAGIHDKIREALLEKGPKEANLEFFKKEDIASLGGLFLSFFVPKDDLPFSRVKVYEEIRKQQLPEKHDASVLQVTSELRGDALENKHDTWKGLESVPLPLQELIKEMTGKEESIPTIETVAFKLTQILNELS